jgi:hypothetical protein
VDRADALQRRGPVEHAFFRSTKTGEFKIMFNNLSAVLVYLLVLLIVFLIFREVLCWYWKINRAVALLTEIRDSLASKGHAQSALMPPSRSEPSI